jgi:hypothetical protein
VLISGSSGVGRVPIGQASKEFGGGRHAGRDQDSVGAVAIVAGVAGGIVALAIGALALVTGVVDGHSTRVVERASSPPATAAATRARPLDARSIYAADGAGSAGRAP